MTTQVSESTDDNQNVVGKTTILDLPDKVKLHFKYFTKCFQSRIVITILPIYVTYPH